VRRVAGIALAALAVLAAALPTGAAADTRPIESVTVYRESAKHPFHHALLLKVWPLKGIATVETLPNEVDLERGRGVTYAVAVAPHPLEGSIDVSVPGLGEFVGTIASKQPEKCGSARSTHFEGLIEFHDAGGYGTWRATHAPATVTRSCARLPEKEATPRDLFVAVSELGPTLPGSSAILFEAESRDHSVVFAMSGDSRHGASFVGLDREWRDDAIAVERWVSRQKVSFAGTVTLGPGSEHPANITFRPPKPFFGVGRYSRRSHRLTGSLGATFLGLRARLAPHPLVAALSDEEPR
jgi:hypothetical protein